MQKLRPEEASTALLAELASARQFVDVSEASELNVPLEKVVVGDAPRIDDEYLTAEMQLALQAHDSWHDTTSVFNELELIEMRLLMALAAIRHFDELPALSGEDTDETTALWNWLAQAAQGADGPTWQSGSDEKVATLVVEAAREGAGRKNREPVLRALLDDLQNAVDYEEGTIEGVQSLSEQMHALRTQLLDANLRLAYWASRRGNYLLHPIEALAASIDGLEKAIARFEPLRGYKFATYAGHWMRSTVRRANADHGQAIRSPSHVVTRLYKAKRDLSHLDPIVRSSLGSPELASTLNLTEEEAAKIQAWSRPTRKGDLQLPHVHTCSLDFVYDDDRLPPCDRSLDHATLGRIPELEEWFASAIGDLDQKQADIVAERLGIGVPKRKILEEIGERYGVTRERIRQIESTAFQKLRRRYSTSPPEDETD